MAGTSIYHCPNIPSCLLVDTLEEFHADRELDQPIELFYRYTGEINNLNGVLISIYSLGKVLELVEEKCRKHGLANNARTPRKQKCGSVMGNPCSPHSSE